MASRIASGGAGSSSRASCRHRRTCSGGTVRLGQRPGHRCCGHLRAGGMEGYWRQSLPQRNPAARAVGAPVRRRRRGGPWCPARSGVEGGAKALYPAQPGRRDEPRPWRPSVLSTVGARGAARWEEKRPVTKVAAGITVSVDGYITGPDDGPVVAWAPAASGSTTGCSAGLGATRRRSGAKPRVWTRNGWKGRSAPTAPS